MINGCGARGLTMRHIRHGDGPIRVFASAGNVCEGGEREIVKVMNSRMHRTMRDEGKRQT